MRQEQFGGATVYRVYERERLKQRARKLGLRLLNGKKPRVSETYSRSHAGPVLVMARKRAV